MYGMRWEHKSETDAQLATTAMYLLGILKGQATPRASMQYQLEMQHLDIPSSSIYLHRGSTGQLLTA